MLLTKPDHSPTSLASMMLLYNILVDYWYAVEPELPPPDLLDLVKAVTVDIWRQLDTDVGWFYCAQEKCIDDRRPSRITMRELMNDLGYVLCCEYCDHFCHWGPAPPQPKTPAADAFRREHPNHPN